MSNKSSNKKVILLELDPDIADWLKKFLESCLLEYPWVKIGENVRAYMQAELNAQLVIGKIIEQTEKGKTVRLSSHLSDYA